MDIKEIFKNKKVLISLAVTVLIIIFIIFIFNNRNDGMSNTNKVSIYYKTYSNGKWSHWSKDGLTSGKYNQDIENIKIKVKTKLNGYVFYNTYSNGKWSKDLESDSKTKNQKIQGLSFENMDTLYNGYNVCYRTYNKKDKWLEWTCNGETSGNIKENITALEIKIIPKNVNKYEWLKDYNKTLKDSNKGF